MARRRINIRFIIGTVSVVGLSAGVTLIMYKNHKPRNPQPYITAGDICMQRQEYDKAAANYAAAAELLPKEPSIHLKLGRAYFQEKRGSTDSFIAAVGEFTKAEELNPNSKEAWAGLLEANELRVELWETHPGDTRDRDQLPASINMAREAADHLVKLEPTNVNAQAAGPVLIIRVWILNLAMPESYADRNLPPDKQLSPDQRAEQAMVDLSKLMRDHPENEKIPYWIARAKVYQGQLALKGDHPQDASPLFAEASNQFEESIHASPKSVGLYLNKAAILTQLEGTDPDPHAWQDYRARLHDTLDKAQSLADPKNLQEYELAKQQWARNLSATDPNNAEAVYRDLITRFPDELGFRIELAKLLQRQPARRGDALVLMNQIPVMAGPSVTNALERENWERLSSLAKLVRADIETDQLSDMGPGKERTALAKDIQSSLDDSSKRLGGTSTLLRVQGRYQLTNGQVRDAIQTLTMAADKMTVEAGNVDYDLLHDEAEAYRRGGQAGKAIELLERAASDPNIANNAELQNTLAELNLQNQDYAKAGPYVNWLAERFPNDKRIIALQIRQLGPGANPADVKPLFDKLPETTPQDMAAKYSMAMTLGNRDEGIRLLISMHKLDPADIHVTDTLVQQLMTANRDDEAKKYLSDTEALHPGDKTLRIVREVVENPSNKNISKDELAAIQGMPDPFIREGRLADFYRAQQNPDEVLVHLKKQLEIQPDNKAVLQAVFIQYMDTKRFSEAEAMLPHLTDLDADDAHGLMLKTKLALTKQDIPNALIFSRQMTHDLPNFAGSWEMYGEALRGSGQLDLACEQFVAALALQATNLDASKNLIQCSVQQGKTEDAKAYIASACKRFPSDPNYRDMRMQFEILYGNPESVIPELTDLVKKFPDDQRNYGMLADAQLAAMRAKSQLGDSAAANQYLQATRDTFALAVARWPDDIRFANGVSQTAMQSNDLPAAESALKTISERPHWKDQPAPLILLARMYIVAGKTDLAEAALHRALDTSPNSVEAHIVLADCLIIQQKYQDALVVLQPVTANFDVRTKYCDLLVAMGRGSQAEVGLQDAIKADPANAGLTNLLLHIYDAQGKYEQGIRAASDAILSDPRNVFAYFWRGKMEASGPTPDLDSAIKDLNFFRDALPTTVEGRIALAQALEGKRDRDGSIRELESALQFDQQNRQVRYLLLQSYLTTAPPRTIDAEHLLAQTLAIPAFAHDAEFESEAAMLSAQKGDNDKAVATMQDAMQHTKDKSALIHNYFAVLLATKDPKNLSLLLDESNQYAADPKTNWFVYSDRAAAKAGLGDTDGAAAEFAVALDRAGAQQGRLAPEEVANNIALKLGVDKALAMVVPRSANSVTWKVIAADLYVAKGDLTAAMAVVDSAMTSESALTSTDRFHLYQLGSSLYINATPPQTAKAVAIYQKMLVIQPDDVEALNDMACVLSDLTVPPNPQAALNYSQRAYDLSVKSGKMNTRIYDTQGWVLLLNGRTDEGIDVMHRAIDQADFPEAHYHLAEAYLHKELPEEAQHELSTASDMIQAKVEQRASVDMTLKDKIDSALKQADEMIRAKSPVKAAS